MSETVYCDACHRYKGDIGHNMSRLDLAQIGDAVYSLALCDDCYSQYQKPGPFTTIEQIKRTNAETGGHFFDASTMRAFKSRISSQVYAGRYFVTSEKQGNSYNYRTNEVYTFPRQYKVRFITNDGDIRDVTGWLPTLRRARQVAEEIDANLQP